MTRARVNSPIWTKRLERAIEDMDPGDCAYLGALVRTMPERELRSKLENRSTSAIRAWLLGLLVEAER